MARELADAKWIRASANLGDICPVFSREFTLEERVKSATLTITAMGTYYANLNGQNVSDYVLAPGWTSYQHRLQYQTYDVTDQLKKTNRLQVTVGRGWYSSPMPGWMETPEKKERYNQPIGLIAALRITFSNGRIQTIMTDSQWQCATGPTRFSEIYDGEVYDANAGGNLAGAAKEFNGYSGKLISQEGEPIKEQERIRPRKVMITPAGETLVDFGQEVTGYVEINVDAESGSLIRFTHGEMLDKQGNFYNENYRSAKAEVSYTCKQGEQVWHPRLTFFGFRYIKVLDFPGTPTVDNFAAITVYSDINQTGQVKTSNALLNQLISNIFWGQKDNFLDVPTDCPQRDERLGWTGDATAFIKAASYNFDVKRFFEKWLADMRLEQRPDGAINDVVPDYLNDGDVSAAWGDAITIIPWQLYQTYGDVTDLKDNFSAMKKWVEFVRQSTTHQYLWFGGKHFGDWLGLDSPAGSYKGSTRDDFIASAYFIRSVGILIQTGHVLDQNVAAYEDLHEKSLQEFRATFNSYRTQTECALAITFGLTEDLQATTNQLVKLIQMAGDKMQTGFVGTPLLLHALSQGGRTDIAYTLLLREDYPSWLYSVKQGATTLWEHWDGVDAKGDFWSDDMNSFNHYAYGAVIDWMYEVMGGITPLTPGFAKARIAPQVDGRLGWIQSSVTTKYGVIKSQWEMTAAGCRYEITTPVETEVVINQEKVTVTPGQYVFWGKVTAAE